MSLFRRKPTEADASPPEIAVPIVPPSPETHPEQFGLADEPQKAEDPEDPQESQETPTAPRTTRHTPETKARVAAALASGETVSEAAKSCRVDRGTIWRWTAEDPEFKAMRLQAVEGIVAHAAISVRGLGDKVIEAWERGLAANTRFVAGKDGQVIGLPDDSLAVKTSEIVSRRIPELAPHQGLEVSLSASEELARVILDLDAAARGS